MHKLGKTPITKNELQKRSDFNINKNVIVLDEQGNLLESTYQKRAKQLVKAKRAKLLCENKIMLFSSSHMKGKIMNTTDNIQEVVSEATCDNELFDDKEVLQLAQEKITAKKNLKNQIFKSIIITILLLLIISFNSYSERAVLAFCYCFVLFIRLLVRIIKFAVPSYNDRVKAYFNGIRDYFKTKNEAKLKAEYEKQKILIQKQNI